MQGMALVGARIEHKEHAGKSSSLGWSAGSFSPDMFHARYLYWVYRIDTHLQSVKVTPQSIGQMVEEFGRNLGRAVFRTHMVPSRWAKGNWSFFNDYINLHCCLSFILVALH